MCLTAPRNDVARLKTITYRAIKSTGTLIVPEKELRGLSSISYIHVSVSDLYIPRICLPIWLQQNRQTAPGNI
jgi:hypothetical protein